MAQETPQIAPPKPAGTVTFLFSDIEGSTQLLHRLGDKYAQALEEQRVIMRAALQQFAGFGIDTAGDGFFVAFRRAQDGVAAAIAAQNQLAGHQWPEGEMLRVRMALHTGEPVATTTGYVGVDVHRAARLCSAGYGGQILLSETTRQLVTDNLPEGVNWRDLGAHRLKDLLNAEHIYQIIIPNLLSDFPGLKTLSSRPNNLPAQLTPLVGREHEIEAVKQLLLKPEARLITLTGPGGIGKTSLSLQVAASLLDEFALERLQASDDWPSTRRRHADFFLALAEKAEPELTGPKQALWLNIIEREHDNLRAVFSWIEEHAQAVYGLRLGSAIWRFWLVRGHEQEGRERLTAILVLPGADKPTHTRAKALNAVGTLMHGSADFSTARMRLEESLEISRKLGNQQGVATVINNLGWIAAQLGELDAAEKLSQESLALHTELGDKRGRAVAFNNLAWAAYAQSEFALAYSLQEKNLSLRQEIGDERGVAFAMGWLAWVEIVLGNYDKAASLLDSAIRKLQELGDNMIMGFAMWILAQMAIDQGDYARAAKLMEENPALLKEREPHMLSLLALVKQHDGDEQQAQALLEESLSKFRAWGYKWGIAITLTHMGRQALDRKDYERATACFQESIILNRELKNTLGIAKTLVGFGDLALAEGDPARSARHFAAAEALHQSIGAPLPPFERTRFDREVVRVRALLDEETFTTAWNSGKNMKAEQAVSYVLKEY